MFLNEKFVDSFNLVWRSVQLFIWPAASLAWARPWFGSFKSSLVIFLFCSPRRLESLITTSFSCRLNVQSPEFRSLPHFPVTCYIHQYINSSARFCSYARKSISLKICDCNNLTKWLLLVRGSSGSGIAEIWICMSHVVWTLRLTCRSFVATRKLRTSLPCDIRLDSTTGVTLWKRPFPSSCFTVFSTWCISWGRYPVFCCYKTAEYKPALWHWAQSYYRCDALETTLSLVVFHCSLHLVSLMEHFDYCLHDCAIECRLCTHRHRSMMG